MTTDKTPEKISEMFDDIALNYDRNNNIISLGLHNRIKKLALKNLTLKDNFKILDICCGTGDIEKILLKTKYALDITGIDFSEKMLLIANDCHSDKVHFIKADATDLPFEDNSFDTITMTFGLRNIQNRTKAIKEAYRVLRKDGEFLHLDFGVKNFPSKIFDFIAKTGIKLFYKDKLPYEYLINSKKEFPEPDEIIKEFAAENFKLKKKKDFLLGIISMQIYTK
ncbi:ubiquinone/menaquinone biosynthesis methyltransferase [bacterium]|nr:ubiquinone/menaquinone biosynthesis methyltransferase [bacterium]